VNRINPFSIALGRVNRHSTGFEEKERKLPILFLASLPLPMEIIGDRKRITCMRAKRGQARTSRSYGRESFLALAFSK